MYDWCTLFGSGNRNGTRHDDHVRGRMGKAIAERFERSGWCFLVPRAAREMSVASRDALVRTVLETVAGKRGAPLRRSRHATTWRVELADGASTPAAVFVKQLDPICGVMGALKRFCMRGHARHLIEITWALSCDGFAAAPILIAGTHRASGHEVIVAEQVAGFMTTPWMNPKHGLDRQTRRGILRALGAEVARLHLAGYVHGDLTPYNVFVTSHSPAAFAFIDHERTVRAAWFARRRRRMRNLVQLGHFDLPGISRTDRARVFAAYAAAAGLPRRSALRQIVRMLNRRLERDRLRARAHRQDSAAGGERGLGAK